MSLKRLILIPCLLISCTPSTPLSSPTPSNSPPSSPSASPQTLSTPVPILLKPVVSTLAGAGTFGYLDEIGDKAQFYHPNGVVVDGSGNILVADRFNYTIRKITPTGQVTTLAGNGEKGFLDGDALAKARFNLPIALGLDSSQTLYIADTSSHAIRKLTPQGEVSTLAGIGDSGFQDGTGQDARFNFPSGIAIASDNTIYISDRSNHAIRKMTPAGQVTTLVGSGEAGFLDGQGNKALFNEPMGLALAPDGNLYVSDSLNHCIRRVTPQGQVSTVAGSKEGFADGKASEALFNRPAGIVADPQNNLYLVDRFNQRIRKITPSGEVSTLAGLSETGLVNGSGEMAQFNYPLGIGIDKEGNLYIADHGNHAIRKLSFK